MENNSFKGFLPKVSWVNKYTVTLTAFFVWMLFFDRYNIYSNYKLKVGIDRLEQKKVEYQDRLIAVRQEKIDFDNDIEKYAREKYYMHKENEKVFIIDSNSN